MTISERCPKCGEELGPDGHHLPDNTPDIFDDVAPTAQHPFTAPPELTLDALSERLKRLEAQVETDRNEHMKGFRKFYGWMGAVDVWMESSEDQKKILHELIERFRKLNKGGA